MGSRRTNSSIVQPAASTRWRRSAIGITFCHGWSPAVAPSLLPIRRAMWKTLRGTLRRALRTGSPGTWANTRSTTPSSRRTLSAPILRWPSVPRRRRALPEAFARRWRRPGDAAVVVEWRRWLRLEHRWRVWPSPRRRRRWYAVHHSHVWRRMRWHGPLPPRPFVQLVRGLIMRKPA
jgi:hypothetical protein